MAERVRARPRELTLHQRLRLEPGERPYGRDLVFPRLVKLLTSWGNWPSDIWFAALSLDLCRDLRRRNVCLALSLVLDGHLSGSASQWGKYPEPAARVQR